MGDWTDHTDLARPIKDFRVLEIARFLNVSSFRRWLVHAGFSLALVLLISACAPVLSEVRYSVAHRGSVAMKKLPPDKGLTTFPWLDPDEVFFTSCGFAQVDFRDFDVSVRTQELQEKQLETHTYFWMTGEWCDIGPGLLERQPTADPLIAYRVWKGKRYIVTTDRVLTDAAGRDCIPDPDVIEYLNLTSHLADLKQTSQAAADDHTNGQWQLSAL